jgi:succinyl-CoA synthetase alpha subunit
VVAYLAGRAAPPGKRMGHAGAIIERGVGTLESKQRALTEAGATVVAMPWEVPDALRRRLAERG